MPPAPLFEEKKLVSLYSVLGQILCAALGLWLLYALRTLIPPFLLAAIIAMTLTPEIDKMERRGWKRGLAIAVTYVLFLAVVAVVPMVLVPLVSSQMTGLITAHIPNVILHGSPQDVNALCVRWMNQFHIPTPMRPAVLAQAERLPGLLADGMRWFGDNLPAMAQNAATVVLVPVIAFFILLDFHKIIGKMLILAPKERRQPMLTIITDIVAMFGNYIRGVLLVMLLDMLVIYLVLFVAGIREYALTLAVTMGILYSIPYFGAVFSTLMIGFVTFATKGAAPALAVTGVMIFIHQFVFDNIVGPKIIGRSVNLHPLLTLFVLLAGGTLFGIGGILLAVPIAAAIQIVLVHVFPQLKMDVVAMHRAADVVRATLAEEVEIQEPPSRKEGDLTGLKADEAQARAAAKQQPAVLPPTAGQER